MADIQLNKPLYKSDDDQNFTPPTPRAPKANILARVAALFLDIMLLHLICVGIIKVFPLVPLALGWAAPWVGLLLGMAYFTLGFSHITLGRTLGKLIVRVQVCEIAGPDLSVGRAAARAALLFWPFAVRLIINTIADQSQLNDPTSGVRFISALGDSLVPAWALANFLFAVLSPFNRTVYDRLTGSVVVNAEIEAEPMAAHLAEVRQANAAPPTKNSLFGFVFGIALPIAMGSWIMTNNIQHQYSFTSFTPELESKLNNPAWGMNGYWPEVRESTSDTLELNCMYLKPTLADADALKADPASSATLEFIVSNYTGADFEKNLKKDLNYVNARRMWERLLPVTAPQKIRFNVGHGALADLFFANEILPVYTISTTMDIPTTITDTLNPGTSGTATAVAETSPTLTQDSATSAR